MNARPACICEKCGATMALSTIEGLCPRCLIAEALDIAPAGPNDTKRIHNPFFVRRFGDYELLDEIARGGMGVVYKARQTKLGRIVAVKVLSAGEFASREFVARFKTEAGAAARLQHPNIVAIHEVGEQDGIHYFSMEYVEGPNLSQLVGQGPLQPERAANYLKTIAEAIQYAHLRDILHRDLKPSNVLIDPFGEPRITDFGLAKELADTSDITATGQVLGTPGYMPPEQADSTFGVLGPTGDVYSLGAILYFMLTGRAPFSAGSLHETLRQVLTADPIAPRMLTPSVPRDLETICLKCLEKEPSRRYSSASELVWELDLFLAGKPIRARPISWPDMLWRWCRRQPAIATLAAVVLVLLIAIAFGSTFTAVRIASARDAEARERTRAEHMLNQLELQRAEDMLRDNRVSPALAYLANVLRKEPTNRVAASRIMSVLMQRSFPLPVCLPIRHGAGVNMVAYSPDGATVASASDDGAAGVWSCATGRAVAGPFHHSGPIGFVAFSRDGKRLYTTSNDGTARIWDLAAGREAMPALAHEGPIVNSEISADGQVWATVTKDLLRIWNSATGQLLCPAISHGGDFNTVDVSADGGLAAIGGLGNMAKVWNTHTGVLVVSIPEDHWIRSVQFTPDGKNLLCATYSGKANVWEIPSGKLLCEVRHRGVIPEAAVSPDGKRFATVSWDGEARVWDVKTGEPLVPPMLHRTALSRVAFSQDGQKLITTGWGNTAWLWDATTGKSLAEPIQHDGRIESASFSPDGRSVVTGSADRTLMLWDVRPGQQVPLIFGHAPESTVALNAVGTRLLTFGQDGTTRVWDLRSGRPITPIMRHREWVTAASFSPDGSRVVTCSLDKTAAVWDATNGQRLATISGHEAGLNYAEFSPDGKKILTASRDLTAGIWNSATGEALVPLMRHKGRIWNAHFSQDGRKVVTASGDGTAQVWVAATGLPAGVPLQHGGEVYSALFDRDGRRVVTASADMTARIWDASTGHPMGRSLKHGANLRHAEFSPDGERVVTVSGDNTARIWDAESGRPAGEPLQHQGEVWSARFSKDGRILGTVSFDGSARIWNALTGQPLTEALSRGGWFGSVALTSNKRWLAAGHKTEGAFVWEIPETDEEPPAWLANLAEAVACKRVSEAGFDFISAGELNGLRARQPPPLIDSWERFLRWFFADRDSRPISPSSAVSVPTVVDRLVDENTYESLRDAVKLAPDRQSSRIKLARIVTGEEADGSLKNQLEPDVFKRWVLALPEADFARAERWESDKLPRALEVIHSISPAFETNATYHYVHGRMATRAGRLDEGSAAFEAALKFAPKKSAVLRGAAALGRRNILLQTGKRAEAVAAADLPLTIPGRFEESSANQLDLSLVFNALLDEPWHNYTRPDNNLKNLPRGNVILGGTLFDLRGIVQLSGERIHLAAPGYPHAVADIPVGRLCHGLSFLHGAGFADGVPAGTCIGQYRIRYEDDTAEIIPLINGEDLFEWLKFRSAPSELKRARVVWEGKTPEGGTARLFERVWENPHPDLAIRSFDFISAETMAAPFLIAVTAD